MKITINETLRRELKTLRSEIQTCLDNLTKSNGALGKLRNRQEKLTAEIAEIEEMESPSKDAIAALGQKQTELGLVKRQIDKLSGAGTPQGEVIAELNKEAAQAIQRALKPAQASYEAEIEKAMRPFYRASTWGIGLVRATDAAREFGLFVHRGFGSSISEAALALRIIEQVLSGELDWKFDPESHR